jgi:hypothetical protein
MQKIKQEENCCFVGNTIIVRKERENKRLLMFLGRKWSKQAIRMKTCTQQKMEEVHRKLTNESSLTSIISNTFSPKNI